MYAHIQGGYIMGQLEQMIEGMREVLARHVASAAAALPADATVRFDGVDISGHPLDPDLAEDRDWCMARFALPVDAVAALASTSPPGPQWRELAHEHGRSVSTQQQQQRERAGRGGERERERESRFLPPCVVALGDLVC